MDVRDIVSGALLYPLQNIKALVIFIILGIIAGVIGGLSIMDFLFTLIGLNDIINGGLSIIKIILFSIVLLLILGYMLDIVKWGINCRTDSPNIDIVRQVSNAIKLIIVIIVYFAIPFICYFILGIFFQPWLTSLITIILFVIFGLAEIMAKCRLAKHDNLGEALAIREAINDIFRVGLTKIAITFVILIVSWFVINTITAVIMYYNQTVGGILWGIFGVYTIFFYYRATGLLYSEL